MLQKLTIKSTKKREIVDITGILNDLLLRNSYYEGISFIFCLHTTCSIATVNLLGLGTDEDYVSAYENSLPKIPFKHPHDPAHFGEHFLSTNVGTSLCFPVQSGNLVLGLNQKVALIEFSGPRERRIALSFLKSSEASTL